MAVADECRGPAPKSRYGPNLQCKICAVISLMFVLFVLKLFFNTFVFIVTTIGLDCPVSLFGLSRLYLHLCWWTCVGFCFGKICFITATPLNAYCQRKVNINDGYGRLLLN